jgi:hypothetical protein
VSAYLGGINGKEDNKGEEDEEENAAEGAAVVGL